MGRSPNLKPSKPAGAEPAARHRSYETEAGRGRRATAPSKIPALGWKDILLRVYKEIADDRIVSIAAGVAFYGLLAIFPAIAALVALYGLFADPATISDHLEGLAGVAPGGAVEIIRDQVTRIAAQPGGTLGLTFAIGLGASLWSANAGMKALFDALNIVYEEEEKRGFIRLNVVSLAFTLAGIVLVLLALAAVVVIPIVLQFVGLAGATESLVRIGRWPVLLLGVSLALAVVYRYGPSRERARWRWITWGSALAALLWLAASLLFSWYAANFASYNETYGSLGAVIAFMIWIWISAIVVLLGAELNAEIEHQTARDSTTGPPKPMGSRGATMADTVGPAQGQQDQ